LDILRNRYAGYPVLGTEETNWNERRYFASIGGRPAVSLLLARLIFKLVLQ